MSNEKAIERINDAKEVLGWCQENADEQWMVKHLALVMSYTNQALAELAKPEPTEHKLCRKPHWSGCVSRETYEGQKKELQIIIDHQAAELKRLKAWQDITQNELDKAHEDEVELLCLRDDNKQLKDVIIKTGEILHNIPHVKPKKLEKAIELLESNQEAFDEIERLGNPNTAMQMLINRNQQALAELAAKPKCETCNSVSWKLCPDCHPEMRQPEPTGQVAKELHKAYMKGRSKGFEDGKRNADEQQEIIDYQAAELKRLKEAYEKTKRDLSYYSCSCSRIMQRNFDEALKGD